MASSHAGYHDNHIYDDNSDDLWVQDINPITNNRTKTNKNCFGRRKYNNLESKQMKMSKRKKEKKTLL